MPKPNANENGLSLEVFCNWAFTLMHGNHGWTVHENYWISLKTTF
jgi:hypothetical protein